MSNDKQKPIKHRLIEKNGIEITSENLEEFELAKTQFLNDVSHELRTPLSVIKMRIEAIEDGMYENNDLAFQQLREKFSEFEILMDKMMKTKSLEKGK